MVFGFGVWCCLQSLLIISMHRLLLLHIWIDSRSAKYSVCADYIGYLAVDMLIMTGERETMQQFYIHTIHSRYIGKNFKDLYQKQHPCSF